MTGVALSLWEPFAPSKWMGKERFAIGEIPLFFDCANKTFVLILETRILLAGAPVRE